MNFNSKLSDYIPNFGVRENLEKEAKQGKKEQILPEENPLLRDDSSTLEKKQEMLRMAEQVKKKINESEEQPKLKRENPTENKDQVSKKKRVTGPSDVILMKTSSEDPSVKITIEINDFKERVKGILAKKTPDATDKYLLQSYEQEIAVMEKQLKQLSPHYEDRLLSESDQSKLTFFCKAKIFTDRSQTKDKIFSQVLDLELNQFRIVVNNQPGEGRREVYTTFSLSKLDPIINSLAEQILDTNFQKHCSCVGFAKLLENIDKSTTDVNDKVKLHAQARLQLFHSSCQSYYKSQATVIQPIAATIQVGKGKQKENTSACHHSLLANVKDNFFEQLAKSCLKILREMRQNTKKDFDFHILLILKAFNITIRPSVMIQLSNSNSEQINELQEQVGKLFAKLKGSPLSQKSCLFHYFNNTTLLAPSLVNDVDSLVETQRESACRFLQQVANNELTPIAATQQFSNQLISFMENANASLTVITEDLQNMPSLTITNDKEAYVIIQKTEKLLASIQEWGRLTQSLYGDSPLKDKDLQRLTKDLKDIKQFWERNDGRAIIKSLQQGEVLSSKNSKLLQVVANDFKKACQSDDLRLLQLLQSIQKCLGLQLEGTKTKRDAYEKINHDETLALNEQVILLSHSLEIASLSQSQY